MKESPTVLMVDDDELVLELVVDMLREAGFEVVAARDGAQALELLNGFLPDVIVSDVNMPEVDGFEFVRRLRADPARRSVPVVFLTARGAKADVVTGLGLGADDYLPKPFAPEELLARVRSKVERPSVPKDLFRLDRRTGLLTERGFRAELAREAARAAPGGEGGALVLLRIVEFDQVRAKYGPRGAAEVVRQLVQGPLQTAGLAGWVGGGFALLLTDTPPAQVTALFESLVAEVVGQSFRVGNDSLRLTPVIGWTTLDGAVSADEFLGRAQLAVDVAEAGLDLRPVRWTDALLPSEELKDGRMRPGVLTGLQIAATYLIGLVLPFFAYLLFDRAGLDITKAVYLLVVVSLLITGGAVWLEGFLALQKIDPPPPTDGAPKEMPATAIIAAYLPNEAATVVETVEAMLQIEYPAGLKVILAYNTPRPLPIEDTLREIATRDSRFVPFKVEGSTSKAQNVNAALALATGVFVGIFDADHKPLSDSFRRAYAWLAAGYDIVQGHAVVRNGGAGWVSRTVAIEFESIYAVSHPGRNRLHHFGIFGGSNGYWRRPLLDQIRMRGTMLTEDIDSSLRVVEGGGRIANDPFLISTELAPTTLGALWNQRVRWAQGWFQVSLRHLWPAMRSRSLTRRQKLGMAFLLGWREIYPWISLQVFPLVMYWVYRDGTVHRLNWLIPIFVLTSLFTASVGPGQVFFAYRLAHPTVRQHRRWFWMYLLVASLFYTEWKNLIARVAQLKELVGERAWKVTPRDIALSPEAASPPVDTIQ